MVGIPFGLFSLCFGRRHLPAYLPQEVLVLIFRQKKNDFLCQVKIKCFICILKGGKARLYPNNKEYN